jgi:type VI secretion system protein ImpA
VSQKNSLMDLETLLAPIAGDNPCGSSLRYEGTYDRVREARREDDPSLPMGDWETKLKVADLAAVEKLCQDALCTKSKDLQIAAWLGETWLRRHRIKGLTHGLLLVTGLVERYWNGMYPVLGDEDDPSARVGLFEWMEEVYADRVRRMPLGTVGEGEPLSLLDWELGAQPGVKNSRDDNDGEPVRVTRESLLARISLGSGMRWRDLAIDVRAAIVAAESAEKALGAVVDKPPTLRRLRDVLSGIESLALDGARMNGELDAPAQSAEMFEEHAGIGEANSAPAGSGAAGGRSGAISSRADAYYRLAEAAEYLMRTEPHSPVPYLVKRAVQWGNMSLAELLYEFVGNADDLVAIQRLLGMRGREE